MRRPDGHLVRTAAEAADALSLSAMTGLARLEFDLHRLADGERLTSPGGNERFIYVLAGGGQLTSEADGTSAALETGDFIALEPDEPATLVSEGGIQLLLGRSRLPPLS